MTVVEWIPLSMNPEIISLLLNSFCFGQKERQVIIYAYVIMEHHLHLIAAAPELSKTMKEFKSYTARCIIDYLEDRNSTYLLDKLRRAKLPYKTQSDYQVWQEGNHPQEINSCEMMETRSKCSLTGKGNDRIN